MIDYFVTRFINLYSSCLYILVTSILNDVIVSPKSDFDSDQGFPCESSGVQGPLCS